MSYSNKKHRIGSFEVKCNFETAFIFNEQFGLDWYKEMDKQSTLISVSYQRIVDKIKTLSEVDLEKEDFQLKDDDIDELQIDSLFVIKALWALVATANDEYKGNEGFTKFLQNKPNIDIASLWGEIAEIHYQSLESEKKQVSQAKKESQ